MKKGKSFDLNELFHNWWKFQEKKENVMKSTALIQLVITCRFCNEMKDYIV